MSRAALALIGALLLSGCATRIWNAPLTARPATGTYDFSRLPDNDQDVFIVLAFSGGGTRAAAFNYGVLEGLRDSTVTIAGRQTRMLDEVDVVTAVSGGSYTAAYYGLFGERIFTDFAASFLYSNWQARLLRLLLWPGNWLAIASPWYNRSDLVAEHLDRTLFEHKRFADMSRGQLPLVVINASDLNNALAFPFLQPQFDLLCSDLSTYPVASAVMASSAVPGPFASIGLKNHPGCAPRQPAWIAESLRSDEFQDRRYRVARGLARYADPQRLSKLRLVDGAVTDNLGVRGSIMSPVAHHGDTVSMAGAFTPERLRRVKHVLVVIANAEIYPEYGWSRDGADPGLLGTGMAAIDTSLALLTTENVLLAEQGFLRWRDQVNSQRGPGETPVSVDFAVLGFSQIRDAARRASFDAMPTTFHLKRAQVDALRALAAEQLADSIAFQIFRGRLEGTWP